MEGSSEEIPDSYCLEELAEQHPIAASMFVPVVIERLGGSEGATEATLTVRLRGIEEPGETQRRLRLSWSPRSVSRKPLGIQPNTVTEWAALGVACVVTALYARLEVQTVAAVGDSFDLWVSDGIQQYGLEVGGTITEEVTARHREKVRQLLDNPYRVDGYVVAVGFATRTVIFSFNRQPERQA